MPLSNTSGVVDILLQCLYITFAQLNIIIIFVVSVWKVRILIIKYYDS